MQHAVTYLELGEQDEGYVGQCITKEVNAEYSFELINCMALVLLATKEMRVARIKQHVDSATFPQIDRESTGAAVTSVVTFRAPAAAGRAPLASHTLPTPVNAAAVLDRHRTKAVELHIATRRPFFWLGDRPHRSTPKRERLARVL
jgi:hypothetical protein